MKIEQGHQLYVIFKHLPKLYHLQDMHIILFDSHNGHMRI